MVALALSILTFADVVCAESGHDWRDGELVAAVAVNRHERWGRPLLGVVTRRGQFAAGCSTGARAADLHWRHLEVAARAHAGLLDLPEWWSPGVLWFCSEPRGGCDRWTWRDELDEAGRTSVGHVYWTRRREG